MTQNLKRMADKNEKRMLYALETFARLCKHLTEAVKHLTKDSFKQNLVVRSS